MIWPGSEPQIILHGQGPLPSVGPAADLWLTTRPDAPAPWVSVPDPRAAQARVLRACAAQPVAAAVLLRLLRLSEAMAPEAALEVESLAYSALLGSAGFREWLDRRGAMQAPTPPEDPVIFARLGDVVTLTMADPASHNAMSARMRDALVAALDSCLIDPTRPVVTLTGGARAFCSGGALAEFGLAHDLAAAHLLRRGQSVAGRLFALGGRASVQVGGAAIGAGAEIAAAASQVLAQPGGWFQLPELAMGLIPGAGGTVSLPRRIGRHRAAWLMLTGQRIGAARALDWGLVDRMLAP
ncbi:MAG: enoyl-CoA hydratase/isomerase family protein [Rhodobacterales bacterium]|nr:enoyl-CoA hydratase/isomerase family protein [Rhodobacterales bacterium]MDX5500680.1 enoyl-CoA hydratase/isomerase family protein [Rhodobacterales bacterium]